MVRLLRDEKSRKGVLNLTDSKALRELIESRGLKYKYVAMVLGLSPFGLQRKIDNLTEFKASEIKRLSHLLSLSNAQQQKIFFAAKGDL